MSASRTVVISCAGTGDRLGFGMTKALVEVDGKSLIARYLEMLEDERDIRVVVGYQAKRVMEVVRKYRTDVTFVLNNNYKLTGTGDSVALAVNYMPAGKYVLSLDGDLLVHPDDMVKILQCEHEFAGGQVPITDDPWMMQTCFKQGKEYAAAFSKTAGNYEWNGVAQMRSEKMRQGCGHVFQMIEPHLPVPFMKLRTREIDTVNDYRRAVFWVQNGFQDIEEKEEVEEEVKKTNDRLGEIEMNGNTHIFHRLHGLMKKQKKAENQKAKIEYRDRRKNDWGGVIEGEWGERFTKDINVYKKLRNDCNIDDSYSYWKSQQNWSVNQVFPERYKKQQEFMNEFFVPYLKQSHRLCDLACANGEWAMEMANYAGQVDGFEYSQDMVDCACKCAEQKGITNVSFYQADACEICFPAKYDHFMMMGLLTCIFSEKDAQNIVDNVYQAMKEHGRLIVKDTLNITEKDIYYMLNPTTKYDACYRSKEMYYEIYKKAGFRMEKEMILHEVENAGLKFISLGVIWMKDKSVRI